jgi:hypothetical protein
MWHYSRLDQGRRDLAISNGFGRHDSDGMFSFYVASPPASRSKSATAPGRSANWDDSRRHDRVSAWGH